MLRRLAPLCLLLGCHHATSSDDTDGGPAPEVVAMRVSPPALLLDGQGASAALSVVGLDANGDEVPITATYTVEGDAVTADDAGDVTAVDVGSADVLVSYGDLEPVRVFVAVADVKDGVIPIADDAVLDVPTPVDGSAFGVGWRYRVTLDADVAPGDLVVASQGAEIAGQVVDVQAGDGGSLVTIEAVPIDEIFEDVDVSASFDVDRSRMVLPGWTDDGWAVTETDDGLVYTPADRGRRSVEPDWECDGDLSLDDFTLAGAEFKLENDLHVDFELTTSGLEKLLVTGTMTASSSVETTFPIALEGKEKCELELAEIPFVPAGAFAMWAGDVDPGLEASIGGKITLAEFGFETTTKLPATVDLGLDCSDPSTSCFLHQTFDVASPDVKVEPVWPEGSTGVSAPKVGLEAEAGAVAKLKAGPDFARFDLAEGSLGYAASASLATPETQAADEGYASSFSVAREAKAAIDLSVDVLEGWWSIKVLDVGGSYETPLGKSPTGQLSVAKGDLVEGQPVTLTVTLDPDAVSLDIDGLEVYDVGEIDLYRVYEDESTHELTALTKVATLPAEEGATSYTWDWTPDAEDVKSGATFAAFVKPWLLPLPMELGEASTGDTCGVVLTNGGFEDDLTHWTTGWNASVMSTQSSDFGPMTPTEGAKMLVIGWDDNASKIGGWAWQDLTLAPTTYELTFKYRVLTDWHHGAGLTDCTGGVAFLNFGMGDWVTGTELETVVESADQYYCPYLGSVQGRDQRTDWRTITWTFTSTADGDSGYVYVKAYGENWAGLYHHWIEVDDVVLKDVGACPP